MNIWTVMSIDDLEREPLGHCVIGSYTSRGKALDECVDYIIERIGIRTDFAWSAAHDENHEEAAEFFSERRKDGRTVVKKGCLGKLREYIRDELGSCGAYYVYDGSNSWHFDVDENAVEGELWHTVTWGDSDTEDPLFTTPQPGTFSTKGAAIRAFIDDVKSLYESHGKKFTGNTVQYIEKCFTAYGKCQVDLEDGCCRSCILYWDDAKDIKE